MLKKKDAKKFNVPFSSVGYITYKRTYARRLIENDKNSSTEEFYQTVERAIQSFNTQLGCNFTEEEQDRLRYYFMSLKGSAAGRFLWQLGTDTVERLGLASLQNCAACVVDHPVKPFIWAMDMLMLGSGVGYNIQNKYVSKIPAVKENFTPPTRRDKEDADYIVPDTREGWVKLLGKVLKCAFLAEDKATFSYSTQLIRGKGAPIKGFGGVASGPEELCWGIDEISNILAKRKGKKIRPIDCLDIMNIIGFVVVAGNVRRSAQLAIGDCDDVEFLLAKRWDMGNIPKWRGMSNNSVACDKISDLHDYFWDGYEGKGEPYGLINFRLARTCGRIGETEYPDPDLVAYNPCQPEFATILTPNGIKHFRDLKAGDTIWSKEGWTKVTKKWSTGVKPVYEYRTTGGAFVGTENHRVDTCSGKEEVDLVEKILTIGGDSPSEMKHIPQVVVDGLYLGDGYVKRMNGRDYTYPILIVGENDGDYFKSDVSNYIVSLLETRESCKHYRINTTITDEEKDYAFALRIPNRYLYSEDKQVICSLLRGMYSADGSVIIQKGNSARVTYKTASKELVLQMQLLLSSLGIRSYYTTNTSKDVCFKNGNYTCKESYDINITKDIKKFYSLIGFIQEYKMEKLKSVFELYNPSENETYTSVVEKNYLGDFEVFDITVDNESHTYWTGGLSVSNCVEQGLEDGESCCLAELFLCNLSSYEEALDLSKLIYRVCKHSLTLKCHWKKTEDVIHKNMRMGIGATGIKQASEEQKSWLPRIYKALRAYDKVYSKKNDMPESIKLTTIKPSGTLSLLPGVTPGCHPGYAQYMIRRIRIASNHSLVAVCRKHGYPVEYQKNLDGSYDHGTVVVSFPFAYPVGTVLAKDTSAIDQLETVKWLQTNWSDNSVSCTIYYKPEELPEIKKYLSKHYKNNFKSLSFLLHQNHGFEQAPYEEITKEDYDNLVKMVTPITNIEEIIDFESNDECANGVCPIK